MSEPKDAPSPADPYAYLRENPATPGDTSYLPGEPSATADRPAGRASGGAGEASRAAEAPDDGLLDDVPESVLAGMTRRELRALRARRAAARQASGQEPTPLAVERVPTDPVPTTLAGPTAEASAGTLVAPGPGAPSAPLRRSLRALGTAGTAPAPATAASIAAEAEAGAGTGAAAGAAVRTSSGTALADSTTSAPAAAGTPEAAGAVALPEAPWAAALREGPGESPWAPVVEEPPAEDVGARPRRISRTLLVAGAAAVLVLAVVALWAVPRFLGQDTAQTPTGAPTATADGTETPGGLPLQQQLPTTVTGGEFGVDGPSGVTYQVVAPGWIANTDAAEGSLESYVAQFSGGAELVTLTVSRFGTPEAATAHATAAAEALGTAQDSGAVFPEEDRGRYWVFNHDGLITIVWTDGELNSARIVSESAEAALDFYNGLEF